MRGGAGVPVAAGVPGGCFLLLDAWTWVRRLHVDDPRVRVHPVPELQECGLGPLSHREERNELECPGRCFRIRAGGWGGAGEGTPRSSRHSWPTSRGTVEAMAKELKALRDRASQQQERADSAGGSKCSSGAGGGKRPAASRSERTPPDDLTLLASFRPVRRGRLALTCVSTIRSRRRYLAFRVRAVHPVRSSRGETSRHDRVGRRKRNEAQSAASSLGGAVCSPRARRHVQLDRRAVATLRAPDSVNRGDGRNVRSSDASTFTDEGACVSHGARQGTYSQLQVQAGCPRLGRPYDFCITMSAFGLLPGSLVSTFIDLGSLGSASSFETVPADGALPLHIEVGLTCDGAPPVTSRFDAYAVGQRSAAQRSRLVAFQARYRSAADGVCISLMPKA